MRSAPTPSPSSRPKGPSKTKVTGLDVVGSSEAKKVPGLVRFFSRCFIVFLNCPRRETPKNVIKEIEKKSVLDFFGDSFVKTFRHDFFAKHFFCSAFELSSLRNTRKLDRTKQVEEKTEIEIAVVSL
jgi:hypothetical protein